MKAKAKAKAARRATLNRFPLFGLWAKCAAERIGHPEDDAKALGHGYAVLFAIRARGGGRPRKPGATGGGKQKAEPAVRAHDHLEFGGDALPFERAGGALACRVGGDAQTADTYDRAVAARFTPARLRSLTAAFRSVLSKWDPAALDGKPVYQVYDHWKKACAAGRLVDLDVLEAWCAERSAA